MPEAFDEPVLLIGFNRPDLLAGLIDSLRPVRPARVFVAIDGPRPNRPDEDERVQACRDLVRAIDWPCSIETRFQDSNLGCGRGVSSAINWFFEQVERGIILEDDLRPDPSFFGFCSELLDRYADDPRVFAVSGNTFVPASGLSHPDQPYRFSRVPHIWGWATWRRAWADYTLDITGWRHRLPLRRLWEINDRSMSGTLFWTMTFELLARRKVDTWDGQLVFASMATDRLVATSNVNLVENLGWGPDATHTNEVVETLPVKAATLPTTPVPVEVDSRADAWTRQHHFRVSIPGIAHQTFNYATQRWRKPA